MRDPRPDSGSARPTPSTLAWVVGAIGATRVVRSRTLRGGSTSSMLELVVERPDASRLTVVLRRWTNGDTALAERSVERESAVLTALEATDLPVPRLLAADPSGEVTGELPSVLMSKLPGRLALEPPDLDDWLRRLAAPLPSIHAASIDAPAFELWIDRERLAPPAWAGDESLWAHAIDVVRHLPAAPTAFVHRDYQHFNVLWQRGHLAGIVDWVFASVGPPEIDVGHCRLNLALLFSVEAAERFLTFYEEQASRHIDPCWDLAALLRYLPGGWGPLIRHQSGLGDRVDVIGMNQRVERLVGAALERL